MIDWETYARYNRAVAEVFFTEEADGLPVYLDLDDGAVAMLAEYAEVTPEQFCDHLARAVQGVLSLSRGHIGAFATINRNVNQWLIKWRQTQRTERIDLEPPPVLALLAVFSMAAERMGRDSAMAPNNYFGRLAQILGLRDEHEKHRVEMQYRHHVEFFWNVLSIWLTGLDGIRGLPSAVALTHRYIGLSISQALVREHDRSKLPRFFETYGFYPGQEVTPHEMQPLLDEWMRREPPPISKNLVNIWKKQAAARERIASVVALELESWDGSGLSDAVSPAQTQGSRGEVRLIALPRSGLFGAGGVELGIVARIAGSEEPRRMAIASAVGDDKPTLDFLPGANGWYRLHRPADFEKASILDGVLALTDDAGTTIQRRPRRVMPMRKDDALGLFLEAERLQLAEDGLVFAADDVARDVESVLSQVARPGFRRVDGGSGGVPVGWVLFLDVQVLGLLSSEARAAAKSDLNVLLPSVASQLTFAEGLRLPGRLRKYSAAAPPEIRAVAVGAQHLELRVLRKDTDDLDLTSDMSATQFEQVVCKHEAESAAIIVNLNHEHLPVGDYEVLLYVDHAKDASQRLPFLLRSGDSVDLAMWARSPRLVHQQAATQGWALISANEWENLEPPTVDGATAFGASGLVANVRAPRTVWWTKSRPAGYAQPAAMTLTTPDPSSCLVTGAHYYVLPLATTTMVQGVCRNCGLVKRFPNTPWMAKAGKKARDQAAANYRVDVRTVEPVEPGTLSWDVGLDALMHAGGGAYSALERIALQIEASLLFVDNFTRALEALGHIEIKRDALTLAPTDWEIAPSALVELTDGGLLLSGFWPPALVARLESAVLARGAAFSVDAPPHGPVRRVISGLSRKVAAQVATELEVEIAVAFDAARAILDAAPDLSAAEAALPQVSMPGSQRIQRFDLGSASWVAQHHAVAPGAYRFDSFGSIYAFRREEEVDGGTVRIGTAHLVKHLEALRMGRPLIAYDERNRCVDVPLGADLPGLLGRAAVLCSGRPPRPIKQARILRYDDVPADIADMLAARLSH